MKPRLKSTRAARDLIKAHEPFLATAERRGKRWVVGYGHTAAAKEGVTLKPEDAELLLIYDVMMAEKAVDEAVGAEMAAAMRDALVSFAVSVGLKAFKVSDVARLARAGRHREAGAAMETWVRADEDGRLVVSESLTRRRAAEKALYLRGLDAASVAAPVTPEPEPEARPAPQQAADAEAPMQGEPASEPEPTPAPEPVARTEADASVEPVADAQAPAEPAAPLIELDIAFELEPAAGPVSALAPVETGTPEQGVEATEADAETSAPASDDGAHPDAAAPEAATASPHMESEPSTQGDKASAASEVETAAPVVAADDARDVDAVRQAQDAAIQSVMARMAREIAVSVEPGAPVEPVQLGYSFLTSAHVDLPLGAPAPAAVKAPEPRAAGGDLIGRPAADAGGGLVSVATGPIQPAASPAKEQPEPVEPEAEHIQDQTAAPVEIETPVAVETAPPHPSEAPASAPGLSGDVEGPDHPDKGGDAVAPVGEDTEELHPAVVAGPEAPELSADDAIGERKGDWLFMTNLAVGGVLVGLGGWELGANLDAYLEYGLGYSTLGPIVFGAGVLLSAASGWFVVRRAGSGKSGSADA